jgi:hypothetical protein
LEKHEYKKTLGSLIGDLNWQEAYLGEDTWCTH